MRTRVGRSLMAGLPTAKRDHTPLECPEAPVWSAICANLVSSLSHEAPMCSTEHAGPRMRLELGTPVSCTDGRFGELEDLVIDPISKRVTHIIVRPEHTADATRLVPVDIAEPADDKGISLRCTIDEARGFDTVQEFAYLRLGEFPVEDPDWDVGIEQMLAMPYYRPTDMSGYVEPYDENAGWSYDRVPKGKVEIRRASAVNSADGERVGHVDGFLVDSDDHITHLVLERGHLWRKRDVTIPI